MTELRPAAAASSEVILLPPDRFVARRISLAAGSAVAGQVELALENLSPFPVDQLYHGHLLSAAGEEALVYAAHRKRFSTDEAAAWKSARLVLPAFVALQGPPPTTPVLWLWRAAGIITVAAWDGRSSLPAALAARQVEEANTGAALVDELRARTGLANAPVEEFSGEASGAVAADGKGFVLTIVTPGGDRPAVLSRVDVAGADVREKEFLAERHRTGRRDLLLWRIFSGALAGLAALVLLELGLVGAHLALGRLQAGVAARAPAAERIATAQALSQRIGDLAQRRLMPFEMIASLNRARPASVLFQRVTTAGQHGLEVEAQTSTATDAGTYEGALRSLPEIATVETHDLRARDGTTTFTLAVTFKPDLLPKGVAP